MQTIQEDNQSRAATSRAIGYYREEVSTESNYRGSDIRIVGINSCLRKSVISFKLSIPIRFSSCFRINL